MVMNFGIRPADLLDPEPTSDTGAGQPPEASPPASAERAAALADEHAGHLDQEFEREFEQELEQASA